MTDYTIVEPGYEFIPPPEPGHELEFLELCTRTCYKSEGNIGPGSAERLMKKVVNDYGHYSVTEHLSCIITLKDPYAGEMFLTALLEANPLIRFTLDEDGDRLRMSGNIRMWRDFNDNYPPKGHAKCWIGKGIDYCLHQQWPFFFEDPGREDKKIYLEDSNPLTNTSLLTPAELGKHTTLTCRIIGDRTMSHQLVRHRLAAYSQESQRYCNYGKKGFQFIVPPSVKGKDFEGQFVAEAVAAYEAYNRMVAYGLKPEDARMLLPNCCKTEVVTTYTLDVWKHVFEHRANNPKAQWQIRGIMQGIQKEFQKLLPEVFHV